MPTLTPLQLDWKVGDKALYEFKTVTINSVDKHGGSVSDGIGITGLGNSFHDSLFPVTRDGLRISRAFSQRWDALNNAVGARSLNIPSIHDRVTAMYNTAMRLLNDVVESERTVERGMRFLDEVQVQLNVALNLNVNGTPVIRR
jgi:hypothetical protein